MLRQLELDVDLTLQQCQARLRGIEARVGEVTDIVAGKTTDDEPQDITVVTANNRSEVAVNSLYLLAEGDPPPEGTSLQLAGTAFLEGRKAVVKIYRIEEAADAEDEAEYDFSVRNSDTFGEPAESAPGITGPEI